VTLKGKKNHYNIKILTGYGASISVKNNRLILKNGIDIISNKQETEEWFITNLPYEKILISGKGYVSTDALSLLSSHYRNIVITDSFGKPISLINGVMESSTASKNRIAQYDGFRKPEICRELSKKTIHDKLESQIRFLKLLQRDDSNKVISLLQKNLEDVTEDNYHDIEKRCAISYFRYYATLFDERFGFESRNQSSIRITKRNASDPINGLLNYGYSVLAGEICKFVCGFGLDPYFGYMHKSHSGFMALVYDVIEPFRWLVESSVNDIIHATNNRFKMRLKDFAYTRNGSVVLSDRVKKNFLEKLERNFQDKREVKFKFGRSKNNGMNNCEEITFVKIYIQKILQNTLNL